MPRSFRSESNVEMAIGNDSISHEIVSSIAPDKTIHIEVRYEGLVVKDYIEHSIRCLPAVTLSESQDHSVPAIGQRKGVAAYDTVVRGWPPTVRTVESIVFPARSL